jgi:hypothetical protein
MELSIFVIVCHFLPIFELITHELVSCGAARCQYLVNIPDDFGPSWWVHFNFYEVVIRIPVPLSVIITIGKYVDCIHHHIFPQYHNLK